jgi:hypothetical protein
VHFRDLSGRETCSARVVRLPVGTAVHRDASPAMIRAVASQGKRADGASAIGPNPRGGRRESRGEPALGGQGMAVPTPDRGASDG